MKEDTLVRLTKELKDANFSVNEIYPNILSIENFLSKNEIDEVLDIINSIPEEDWHIEYLQNLVSFCMEKFGRDDVDNLIAEGKFEVTENWKDKNVNIGSYEIQKKIYERLAPLIIKANGDLFLDGLSSLQRMYEGVELKSHTDQHTDPSIQYAAILYLNNDYSDGELFFEKIGIKIKPNPGTVLIFPGNDEYKHGVYPVGSGPVRYVLTAFIKIKDFYVNNKYGHIYIKETESS